MSFNSPSLVVVQDQGRGRTKVPSNGSSTSIVTSNTSKRKLRGHNRSLSHNKALNKLPAISSTTFSGIRPNLDRSKSTDGLLKTTRVGPLKRNNRSFTKISGLHPLTKSASNQSLKSNKSSSSLKGLGGGNSLVQLSGLKTSGRKGKAILRLNEDDCNNEEFEDLENDDENDEENPSEQHKPLEVSSSVSNSQLKSSTYGNEVQMTTTPDIAEESPQEAENYENYESEPQRNSDNQINEASLNDEKSKDDDINLTNGSIKFNGNSNEDLINSSNLYGGSLLLSQSTGQTKKFNSDTATINQRTDHYDANSIPNFNLPSVGSTPSETPGGISFKAKPMDNPAEPVITNKNVIPNNSYQPNHSIFTNLQRTNSQYLSSKNQRQAQNQNQRKSKQTPSSSITIGNGTTNFSNFLNNSQTSHPEPSYMENRTQQRLWLQRENSLMDVPNLDANQLANMSTLSLSNLMFAQNYNQSSQNMRELHNNALSSSANTSNGSLGSNLQASSNDHTAASTNNMNGLSFMVQNNHQNFIQLRTEFERLNREYLNVRRNLNPVGKSIKRLEKIIGKKSLEIDKTRKGISFVQNDNGTSSNSFKEFSPSFYEKEHETSILLNRLWQDALFSSSSTASASPSPSRFQSAMTQQQIQDQSVERQLQRPVNLRIPSSTVQTLRTHQTPTTRKLAASQIGSAIAMTRQSD